MVKAVLVDFARVLLFPKYKEYGGKLNPLHKQLAEDEAYNLFDHFDLNEELLNYLEKIKDLNNLQVFILTSGTMQNTLIIREKLEPTIDKTFSAGEIGIGKTNPQAYLFVANEVGIDPKEILFIDSKKDNIDAAKQAGVQTLHFKDNSQVKTEMDEILSQKYL